MLDHIFLTVADLERSIAFYEKTLAPLGIEHAILRGHDVPAGLRLPRRVGELGVEALGMDRTLGGGHHQRLDARQVLRDP